jgi:hypothetical protein
MHDFADYIIMIIASGLVFTMTSMLIALFGVGVYVVWSMIFK